MFSSQVTAKHTESSVCVSWDYNWWSLILCWTKRSFILEQIADLKRFSHHICNAASCCKLLTFVLPYFLLEKSFHLSSSCYFSQSNMLYHQLKFFFVPLVSSFLLVRTSFALSDMGKWYRTRDQEQSISFLPRKKLQTEIAEITILPLEDWLNGTTNLFLKSLMLRTPNSVGELASV